MARTKASIDILTATLVKEVVDDIEATGRCDFRDVLGPNRLNWGRHFDNYDWTEVRRLAEVELGKRAGRSSRLVVDGRFELIGVRRRFFKWLDSSPGIQVKGLTENGKLIHPDTRPDQFCSVTTTPEGVVQIDMITDSMRQHLGGVRINHTNGRIKGALRLGDTSAVAGVPIGALQRKQLAATVISTISPPPAAPSLPKAS